MLPNLTYGLITAALKKCGCCRTSLDNRRNSTVLSAFPASGNHSNWCKQKTSGDKSTHADKKCKSCSEDIMCKSQCALCAACSHTSAQSWTLDRNSKQQNSLSLKASPWCLAGIEECLESRRASVNWRHVTHVHWYQPRGHRDVTPGWAWAFTALGYGCYVWAKPMLGYANRGILW